MNPIRILLTLLKLFGVGIGLLAALLIVVSVVGVKIPVNFLKGTIQDAARDATGRELLIDGAIVLSPGFSPGVSIQNVTLANSENAQTPSFIRVNELSLQIHLLPLLRDKIHIGDVMLSGVDVDLVKPVTGAPNWIFEPLETGETVNKAEPRDQKKPGMSLIAIDGVRLSDLAISYHDEASQTHNNLTLSSGMLQAPEDIPASFRGEGMLNALPVSMQLESDPLQKLFVQSFPLNLEFVSKIGATDLEGFIKAVDSGMHISIDLLGEDLSQLGDNFGFSLPDVRNYQASTSIDYDKKEFRISAFHATVDNSDIDAELTMSHGRSPVEISGAIDINTLELDPFLKSTDEKNVSSTAQVSGPPEQEKSINTGEISDLIKQLSKYAADLRVNIGRLTAGGLVITDSNLQLNLAEGKLNTPVNVVLNSIPMEGKFSLSQTDGLVTASASLEVQNTDIGDLEQWFNLDGIDGSLGKFSLSVATNGQNLQSLAKQISADLVIEGAELQYGGDEEVQGVAFTLERMSASVADQSPLAVTANGVLLDQAFTIDLTGGKLSHLLTGADWPLEITAKGAGAELRIEGNIREPGEQTGSELSLLLSGSRLGDLYNWLGVSNKAEAAYIIRALVSTRVNGWEISSYQIGLGETSLKGQVSAMDTANGTLLGTQIISELIDISELASFFNDSPPATTATTSKEEQQKLDVKGTKRFDESTLDIPILPTGVYLPEMNIDVTVNELRLENLIFNNIEFGGAIRDGILNPSPFSMHLGQAKFFGEIAFDSLSSPPSTSLLLETKDIDIGDMLNELSIAEDIDLSAGLMRLKMDLKGHNLDDILHQSSLTAEIKGGQWVLTDAGSGATFPMELKQGKLSIEPDTPVTLIHELEYGGEQIGFAFTMDRLIEMKAGDEFSLKIDVQHRDNTLSLVGTSPLPIKLGDTEMSLNMSGSSVGSLRTVTGLPVPEFGAYELLGKFSMNDQGYYLKTLKAQIGESVIEGTASLKTSLSVPEFDVQVVSEHFQLNDFKIQEENGPEKTATEDSNESATETASDNEAPASDSNIRSNGFKPQSLALVNGSFNLKAKDVVSGEDWLGEGEINLELRDGKLDMAPITVKLPGGNFDASMSIEIKNQDLYVTLNAMIDQFDYGVLARRNNPETKMTGIIDLDLALESTTASLDTLMAGANGHIDFVVLPEHFEAGAIDLWAASLLVAILPKLGTNVSLVNCVIAQFDISDGIMQEKELYLDTSKLRARGKGKINFKDQTLSYILKPKAKTPGLFQLQAPLKIEGSFADIQLGLQGGLIGSTIGMLATTATVPFRVLMGKHVPRDGSDICVPLSARQNKQ